MTHAINSKHKLTYCRHHKNAYSGVKEFKRTEREWEGNEERKRVTRTQKEKKMIDRDKRKLNKMKLKPERQREEEKMKKNVKNLQNKVEKTINKRKK